MFLKGKQPCNKNNIHTPLFLPVNMHLKKYFKGKMYVLLLYNKCSENSRAQIVFRTDIFQKLTLGAPDYSDEKFISNDLNTTSKTHLSWLPDNVLHNIREHFSMTSVTSILKHKCSHKFNTPILIEKRHIFFNSQSHSLRTADVSPRSSPLRDFSRIIRAKRQRKLRINLS